MQCEDFLVALFCLFATIERLKEIRAVQHGVVGPLLTGLEEERVKNSLVFVLLMVRQQFLRGGRAVSAASKRKNREYDSTKGFPGEDIISALNRTEYIC